MNKMEEFACWRIEETFVLESFLFRIKVSKENEKIELNNKGATRNWIFPFESSKYVQSVLP